MDIKFLKDYARLLARKGLNIKKGDIVFIHSDIYQPDFVKMVVEECYLAGAKRVRVIFSYEQIEKLSIKYMPAGELGKATNFDLANWKYVAKNFVATLYLISEDPNLLKGINMNKYVKARNKRLAKIMPIRDLVDGKQKWCIAAVPGPEWAKEVFPNMDVNSAMEELWKSILSTSRVDGVDACKNWDEHNAFLDGQRKKLEDLKLQYLEYKSSNGTDFKVELIKGIKWGGGHELTDKKEYFNPNIPSEEVFTSPKAGSCDGIVYSSLPLSLYGRLVEDFSIRFKDGKIVEVKAKKNQDLLEKLVATDEGSKMLGEVALVPYDSPIRQSGILFYETLFDENAACHLAIGRGFKECLPNGDKISIEEATKLGINYSLVHVDFMIGTKDLSIVGISENGTRTQIFKNGNWAI